MDKADQFPRCQIMYVLLTRYIITREQSEFSFLEKQASSKLQISCGSAVAYVRTGNL